MAFVAVIFLVAIAVVAGVLTTKHEEAVEAEGRAGMIRRAAYCLFTTLVVFELAAGAVWDLLRIEYVRVVLTHLGYPLYVLFILGVWRVAGALALLAPHFPRLKEWAYAGALFEFTGAAVSHVLAGDHVDQWIGPVILSGFTLLSWALRPGSRRLPGAVRPAAGKLLITCGVPFLTVAAMLAVAFFTLPKGAPPQ